MISLNMFVQLSSLKIWRSVSIILLWEVTIFSVKSFIFVTENICRRAWVTLRMQLPLLDLTSCVTGVVIILLRIAAVMVTWVVLYIYLSFQLNHISQVFMLSWYYVSRFVSGFSLLLEETFLMSWYHCYWL